MLWKSIAEFGDYYEVSSTGLIKACGKYINAKNGSKAFRREKIMSLKIESTGYASVTLTSPDGVVKTKKVHRLVAEAFIPAVADKLLINHKNGIKLDNRAENLEWCTPKENGSHAIQNGLYNIMRGESCPASKLKSKQIAKIIYLYQTGEHTQQKLADKFGVSRSNIGQIVTGKTWLNNN